MVSSNPFAVIAAFIPPAAIQGYVVVMILLVAGGTLVDIIHKKSARYFFNNWRKMHAQAGRSIGGMKLLDIALRTLFVDVLAAGEFCNQRRRAAHLLTMYGFLLYVVTTGIMAFDFHTAAIVTVLWYLGAFMVCVGGYWFWFLIRVDVAAEGRPSLRMVRADLFVVSLVASTTLALIWAFVQASGNAAWTSVFVGLYLIATTVLFASIPWSKFAHMFFKPAAAFQRRVAEANETRDNLPEPARKPVVFGNPRREPRNY